MKQYDTKMLVSGLIHAAIVLGLIIYSIAIKTSEMTNLGMFFYCFLCVSAADLRWSFMYEAYKPDSKVLSAKFVKPLPHFVDDQPKMNSIMARTYIWFVVSLVRFFTLF